MNDTLGISPRLLGLVAAAMSGFLVGAGLAAAACWFFQR
jgi:hypothetical protein